MNNLEKDLLVCQERLEEFREMGRERRIRYVQEDIALLKEAIAYIDSLDRPLRHGGYVGIGVCLEWLQDEPKWKEKL